MQCVRVCVHVAVRCEKKKKDWSSAADVLRESRKKEWRQPRGVIVFDASRNQPVRIGLDTSRHFNAYKCAALARGMQEPEHLPVACDRLWPPHSMFANV